MFKSENIIHTLYWVFMTPVVIGLSAYLVATNHEIWGGLFGGVYANYTYGLTKRWWPVTPPVVNS
jgi:hypothetical protein